MHLELIDRTTVTNLDYRKLSFEVIMDAEERKFLNLFLNDTFSLD